MIDQALRSYQNAWNMYVKNKSAKKPHRHTQTNFGSFQVPNRYPKRNLQNQSPNLYNGNIRFLDCTHLMISLIGRIRVAGSQKRLMSRNDIRIGTVTITKDSTNRFYISLQLASSVPFVKTSPANSRIGIDLNINNFFTTSDNQVVKNPRFYEIDRKKIQREQHILSRRCQSTSSDNSMHSVSSNYQKQRTKINNLFRKVANRRKNFLHKVSKVLIEQNELIAVENLRCKNMLHGSSLSFFITDAGWKMFIIMLEYKAKMYNRRLVMVNPQNTTQTYHICGFVLKGNNKLTLSQRFWSCPNCNAHHSRDLNAAKNILQKALSTATN